MQQNRKLAKPGTLGKSGLQLSNAAEIRSARGSCTVCAAGRARKQGPCSRQALQLGTAHRKQNIFPLEKAGRTQRK